MDLKNMKNSDLVNEIAKRLNFEEKEYFESKNLLKQIKEVNVKLNDAEAMKSHFISNITNEIINPFTSILGLSRNILALDGNNLDRAKKMAALIHSEAFNLDFQLKNIFAAAKIEAGQLLPEYSKVDIESLIKSVIGDYQYKADQKQIFIEFSCDVSSGDDGKLIFITDPDKLKLIMSNLLSNSIKYSNATEKVKLEISLLDKDLNISIRDYGIGIDKKNMKIIFDRFQKANKEINSVIRGHGLGLSVVKSSLDVISGSIEVTSKPRYGTKFTIIIPVQEKIDDWDSFATDSNELFFGDEEVF